MWAYLSALLAAVGATVLLLVALLLKYLPHDYLAKAGLVCHVDTSCQAALPVWALPAFPLLVAGALLGGNLRCGFPLCPTWLLRRSEESRRACSSGHHGASTILGSARRPRIIVHDRSLVSYTIGFLSPRVVISDGLLETLDVDEVQAVLSTRKATCRVATIS